jgi:hypothetical protein
MQSAVCISKRNAQVLMKIEQDSLVMPISISRWNYTNIVSKYFN